MTICGVDEAGRGPLAGPVVAAAVILPGAHGIVGLNDSKRLNPLARAMLRLEIEARCAFGVGMASVEEIDRLNIRNATLLAMRRAVEALPSRPGMALVDGDALPELPCPARAIIGGDGLEPAIMAASILAKEVRDELMRREAALYPRYGFATHKGYPTKAHLEALAAHGPCPIHRQSFAPVRAALSPPTPAAGGTRRPPR